MTAEPRPDARTESAGLLDASLTLAHVMDRGGYPYIIHPLLDGVPRCDPRLLAAYTEWAADLPCTREATLLLAPEAMGLPLVAALALRTGLPYGIIRKRSYGLPGEVVAFCETGYGDACLHINDVTGRDRVLLVDDVISTGATLDALLTALHTMEVPVVGAAIAVDKGTRRAELARKHHVPIHTLRTIQVAEGRIGIVPPA